MINFKTKLPYRKSHLKTLIDSGTTDTEFMTIAQGLSLDYVLNEGAKGIPVIMNNKAFTLYGMSQFKSRNNSSDNIITDTVKAVKNTAGEWVKPVKVFKEKPVIEKVKAVKKSSGIWEKTKLKNFIIHDGKAYAYRMQHSEIDFIELITPNCTTLNSGCKEFQKKRSEFNLAIKHGVPFEENETHNIKPDIIRKLFTISIDDLKSIMFSASDDQIKPAFNGIYFNVKENVLCSSDSRRLSLKKSYPKVHGEDIKTESGIILLDHIKSATCDIDIFETTNGLWAFSFNCFSKLIDAQFPNYKQVIPTDYIGGMNVIPENVKDIYEVLNVHNRKVILSLMEGAYENKISKASVPFLSVSRSSCDPNFKLGINAEYMLDAIKATGSNEAKITGAMSPVVFQGNDITAVIMPLQIKTAED